MFARVTEFKMKPGSRDAATKIMNDLKSQIMGMPGMQSFINVMDDDGHGYVLALLDNQETSAGNAETVKALWARFSEHLEVMPTPKGYDVIANWS